jgi:hypothetical protein
VSDDGRFVTGATGCPDRRFYLFSKESNQPVIRSEMLTRDSPVHRAKISGNGDYAAVGSESGDGAVFLFSPQSNQPIWKYSMPGRSSVRALNFTADGDYIGAATFKGDAYIFHRDSSTPAAHWQVDASLGGLDIAEDGSFIAAGGSDSKLHVFRRDVAEPVSIVFNEYVEEVDISADNRYIAAGTGGSVYFFEALDMDGSVAECREIKEPPVERVNVGKDDADTKNGDVGVDGASNGALAKKQWPGMLFGFGFLGSLLVLAGYVTAIKWDLWTKLKQLKKKYGLDAAIEDGPQIKLELNKIIIAVIGALGLAFLLLTIMSGMMNVPSRPERTSVNEEGQGAGSSRTDTAQQGGCGNTVCEPDQGENKANCSVDCME